MVECDKCEKFEFVRRRVEVVEEGLKTLISTVNQLEKNTAVDRERLSNFTTSILKIESGVEDIRKSMEENAKRPLNIWDKVISAVTGGAIIYILTEVLPVFLKK